MCKLSIARVLVLLAATSASCSSGKNEDPERLVLTLDQLREPSVEFRPWVRWWWPGNDVESAEIRAEIATLASAGFGGAEIQAFDAALDPDVDEQTLARRRSVNSEEYFSNVRDALDQAAVSGILIDLTLGSGWPVGGIHVSVENSLKTMMWAEKRVTGPMRLEWSAVPQKSLFYEAAQIAEDGFGERLARFLPESAVLVAVRAFPLVGGVRSSSIFDIDDTLLLGSNSVDLMPGSSEDAVVWDVPAGEFVIVALFIGPDGEYQTLAAESAHGFVADMFDTQAMQESAQVLLGPVADHPALRGFFSDSFELKVDRFAPSDIFTEFESRRGYSLREVFPAVLSQGADNFLLEAGRISPAPEFGMSDHDFRIREDYRQTIDELFRERFALNLTAFAEERGLSFRSQNHGIDVDLIEAAGAVNRPEVEHLYAGGSEMFTRLVAAGAAFYGRERVSAEAFSFISRDHATTPLVVRATADKLFGTGVNDLIFHGFPYDYPGKYGAFGWTAFSSTFGGASTFASSFSPDWEYWPWMPALAKYVARCQFLLAQGKPQVDVFIYYPFFGFPTSLALNESHSEPLLGGQLEAEERGDRSTPFDALSGFFGEPVDDFRSAWLAEIWPLIQQLESEGYQWSWINDEQIVRVANGSSPISASAIWFHNATAVSPAAALAIAGKSKPLALVTTGQSPTRAFGRGDAVSDSLVAAAFSNALTVAEPADGGLARELGELGVLPLTKFSSPTMRAYWKRTDAEQLLGFMRNPSASDISTPVLLPEICDDGALFDAWTGELWTLPRSDSGAQISISAWSSVFVLCGFDLEATGTREPFARIETQTIGSFTVSAPQAGELPTSETLAVSISLSTPFADLRSIPELARTLGPVEYVASASFSGAKLLRFEDVAGAGQVFVNGAYAGDLVLPPWEIPLWGAWRDGANEIRVILTPPRRNGLIGLHEAGLPEYEQFREKADSLTRVGLIGEAQILR